MYMNYNKLTPQEERVIINKATEPPFKGEYDNFYQDGTFICRRCNAPLFSSKSKFDARSIFFLPLPRRNGSKYDPAMMNYLLEIIDSFDLSRKKFSFL